MSEIIEDHEDHYWICKECPFNDVCKGIPDEYGQCRYEQECEM